MMQQIEGSTIGNPFEGVMAASPTALTKDNELDEPAMRDVIEMLIAGHVQGIVPCGTTGESAGLPMPLHKKTIEFFVDTVGGRVPVIAGTGGNSTDEAIELTVYARDAGADGALIVEPYYVRVREENNVNEYYIPIAKAVQGFPLVAYTVLARTGARFSMYTPRELAKIDEYVAIKFASNLVTRKIAREKNPGVDEDKLYSGQQIIEECGPYLELFSGEDGLNLDYYMIGAKGAVSVAADADPEGVVKVYQSFKQGKLEEAKRQQADLERLNTALFNKDNPGGIKTALYMMGMIQEYAKRPVSIIPEGPFRDEIREALHRRGIKTVEGR